MPESSLLDLLWTPAPVPDTDPGFTGVTAQPWIPLKLTALGPTQCRCKLEKMAIRCERILVLGSQATGTAHEGSDIDLFVISSGWAPFPGRERLEKLGIAAAPTHTRTHPGSRCDT